MRRLTGDQVWYVVAMWLGTEFYCDAIAATSTLQATELAIRNWPAATAVVVLGTDDWLEVRLV